MVSAFHAPCVLSFFSSDGLATFRNFLKSEYSDENIEFWLTCEDYKKIKSSFRMSSRAKKIYEQFIKAESPKEVNPSFLALLAFIYMLSQAEMKIHIHELKV